MPIRLINVGIRGAVLLSRFFFLFALAKMMSPAEVGKYGLLVATVGYSIYFVGLDFYIYTTRNISGGDRGLWGGYLKSQAALSAVLYLIVVPMLIVGFSVELLPSVLAGWFFALLILEHCCLELMRFFIAAAEQLSASIVLFFNQAFWAIFLVLLMVIDERFRHLEFILLFWCGGSLIALCYSFFKIRRMRLGGWSSKVSLEWLWKGVKIALPMLLATLALRGIFTFDRYLVNEFLNVEIVAAYVFFIGVAGVILAFLDAAVFSFAYPALIDAFKRHHAVSFKGNMRAMLSSVVIYSAIFVAFSLWVFPYLLVWIGKSVYLESAYIFYWVLGGVVINALWMVFHYALYSQQLDRPIIFSHLAGFFIFFSLSCILYFIYPRYSVLIGLCFSQAVILVLKVSAYVKSTPKDFLGFALN